MFNEIDLIELLERDHRQIDALAQRLDSVEDPDEIRLLYLQIAEALRTHEAIEQQVLFPAFAELIDPDDTTLDARVGEHQEVDALLMEMGYFDSADFAFMKRASALLLDLEGHFAREEETVFTLMREQTTREQRLELGRQALAIKVAAAVF